MYAAPELIDLGSFQELTLGAGMHSGFIGPVGSLVNSTLHDVGGVVTGVFSNLPVLNDNTILGPVNDHSHIGPDSVSINPTITIPPR